MLTRDSWNGCKGDSWNCGKGESWNCGKGECGKGDSWNCGKGDGWKGDSWNGCKGDGWKGGKGGGKGDGWGGGKGEGWGDAWNGDGAIYQAAIELLNSGWTPDSWAKGGKGDGWKGDSWNGCKGDSWKGGKGGGKGDGWGGGKGETDFYGADGKGKGKAKGSKGQDGMVGAACTVKHWLEDKGFGFVCTESNEDVYCHRTTFVDGSALNPGSTVHIDATWSWERGKWQATKVEGAVGPPPVVAGVQKPVTTGVQYGKVKTWQEKGYGFLVPDNGGPDVFIHKTGLQNVQGLTVGSTVMFDLQQDTKTGKWLAMSCSPVDNQTAAVAATEASFFGPAAIAAPNHRAAPYPGELNVGTSPLMGGSGQVVHGSLA